MKIYFMVTDKKNLINTNAAKQFLNNNIYFNWCD